MKHPTHIQDELAALSKLDKLCAAFHHNLSDNIDDRNLFVRSVLADLLTAITFARSDIKWRRIDIERGEYNDGL